MTDLDLSDLVGRCGMSEEIRKKLKDDWGGSIKELLDKITAESEQEEAENTAQLFLPPEFKSALELSNSITNPLERNAISYLKQRGITKKHIIKYNIGFCPKGLYGGRIIVPSYDDNNQLNFFVGRTFEDNYFKYKNPSASKDIVGFENMINWDQPVILVEGVFDAMAVKRNAVPILGKSLSKSLLMKLVSNKVQDIYIALDKDALKRALSYCEQFLSMGKRVFLVDMLDKDPSEMGFASFTRHVQQSQELTFSDLLRYKLDL
jgi:DNA primase